MAKIARALERKRHAPAGDGCALADSRRARRDTNALVGRRGASGRRARRIIRVSIERHSTAARLISLEGAASAGGHALAIDERSTARHASIDARATVTVGDNAVPNAQSTLLSKHNSHGGLFLRRFRNAPDAASATTTFLQQRRSCDNGVFRNNGALRDSDAFRDNGVLRDGGAFRNGVFCDDGVFCIQGLCEALYHERVRFLLVLAQICGCERWIFWNAKDALQKTRSEAWNVSKRSEKPISKTKNRSQPQICARIAEIRTRFRQSWNKRKVENKAEATDHANQRRTAPLSKNNPLAESGSAQITHTCSGAGAPSGK